MTGNYQLNLANVENVVGSGGNNSVGLVNLASGLSIDLGAGTDSLNLAGGANSITVQNVENIFGTDFSSTSVNDILTLLNDVTGVSVNFGKGNNTINLAAGTNSLDNVFNAQHVNGTASDDTLTVTTGLGNPDRNPIVDLGAGNDTLNLAASFVSLTALNIEHITGSAADNGVILNNNVTGVTFDLGGGNDLLSLAAGANSISVTNVENVSSSDFSTSSDASLTLLKMSRGLTVNLGNGSNTLDLSGGTNSFVDIFNVHQVNGTASDDVLSVSDTIGNQDGNPIVDLGGGNDTLSFGSQFLSLTALNIEHISGSAGDNGLTLNNTVSGITSISVEATILSTWRRA